MQLRGFSYVKISNVYHHLSIKPEYQKFLQFKWQNKCYKFVTLAQGIKFLTLAQGIKFGPLVSIKKLATLVMLATMCCKCGL